MVRLDKFLVNLGFGSRTEIKNFAKLGKIFVNGQKIIKTETKIDENNDEIVFCGQKISYKKNIYIMLNKKAGYVTANSDDLNSTVFELLDKKYQNIELFAVGRLDKDTEGFLLITNDGKLSHGLMSPKKHVLKEYYAEVTGEILDEHIEKFKNGIEFLDGVKCKPAELEIISKNSAYVRISEGKFHQVKNMFRTIDCTVSYLKRTKIAGLCLDNSLEIGNFRELSLEEEQYLKKIAFGEAYD